MFNFKFNENEASRLFRPLAYDSSSEVFVCDDSTMAFSFICTPVCGWDTQMLTTIKLMLNDKAAAKVVIFLVFKDVNMIDSFQGTCCSYMDKCNFT